MKRLKPNTCFKITYPDAPAVVFRTPDVIPADAALTPVVLPDKKVIALQDLLAERWDHFSEIPCEEIPFDSF